MVVGCLKQLPVDRHLISYGGAQVVNHYPPLVYGRCMTDVDPEVSSGAAVYQLKYQGATTYVAITYQWVPNILLSDAVCGHGLIKTHNMYRCDGVTRMPPAPCCWCSVVTNISQAALTIEHCESSQPSITLQPKYCLSDARASARAGFPTHLHGWWRNYGNFAGRLQAEGDTYTHDLAAPRVTVTCAIIDRVQKWLISNGVHQKRSCVKSGHLCYLAWLL